MLIWKKWATVKYKNHYKYTRYYKMLSLFGIIPLWISITVVEEG